MVTLIAARALSSTPFVGLAMFGPLGLSTAVSMSLSALVIAAIALVVVFGLWKKTPPPTVAEVLRGVESSRTSQR